VAQIFITTTGAGTWTSPRDIPIIANSIKVECFGAGAGGNTSGGAGAGGAYSVSFLQLAVNTVYNLSIGAGGSAGVSGGDTWFNGVSFPNAGQACGARGGGAPSTTTGGTGGPAGAGTGAAGNGFWTGTGSGGFSGGNGGSLSTDAGGGGGAAGPKGNGTAGSNGSVGSGGNGGSGDNGSGGSGGAGGTIGSAGVGQPGTEITSAAGSGGGGGGCTTGIAGGGGNYGGGGGGALTTGTPGVGAQGLIVITFTSTNLVFSAFDPPAPSFGNPHNRANFINPRNFQDFVYLSPALPAPTTGGPLLGFDALGRFAIGQNPFVGALPVVYGGSFGIWPPAVAPKNFAKDWVAFSGNLFVETLPIDSSFSAFIQSYKSPNYARDWIAYSEIGFTVVPVNKIGIDFTTFSPGQHARNFARDWIAYSGSIQIEEFPLIGIDFLPFAPGRTAKLWSGQAPQWWPYYFNAPFKPSGRDTHDGGHLRRHWHHRRPSVYSQEYYDELRRLQELREHRDDDDEELVEEIKRIVPNLLIPINRLIPPLMLPSLRQLPPYRPIPSLTMNPPQFRMATPEEIAADDEQIIAMILAQE
jgi:hypothetical protein